MISMLHGNPALVRDNKLWVDRKFVTGMAEYGKHLEGQEIVSYHPRLKWENREAIMDLTGVPISDLGFRVESIEMDPKWRPAQGELTRVTPQIQASSVVYGGGFGIDQMAINLGIPLVLIMEYNFLTQVEFSMANLNGVPRKALRCAKLTKTYLSYAFSTVRKASLIHCNGYPIYDEVKAFNSKRLLYLDSRMQKDTLIEKSTLDERLKVTRPMQLIYSGRFEPAKGTLDAIFVAIALKKKGVPFELDLYGQGSLDAQMRELTKTAGISDIVRVHSAIDYPSLLKISQQKDAFLCCHVQDDPSCTYLEAMGCGLPVIGYGNRMLAKVCESSKAGLYAKKKPAAVADLLAKLSEQPEELKRLSRAARRFAEAHTFESEFARRMQSLREIAGMEASR